MSDAEGTTYKPVDLDDLIKALQDLKKSGVPGTVPVIVTKDGEGSEFSPLAIGGVDTALYDAECTWSGERYMTEADRLATDDPDGYLIAPESAVPAVFLWPTN